MNLLSRRSFLSLTAVVDIALYCRTAPVSSKELALRLNLPHRQLEPFLQALTRHDILKSVRGPRGGYSLMRERRKITAADVVRAVMDMPEDGPSWLQGVSFGQKVIGPVVDEASRAFLATLEKVTLEDLCQRSAPDAPEGASDFHI